MAVGKRKVSLDAHHFLDRDVTLNPARGRRNPYGVYTPLRFPNNSWNLAVGWTDECDAMLLHSLHRTYLPLKSTRRSSLFLT